MPEHKNYGILSLNVKKLLILHLIWKANQILQYRSLFFIMRLLLVCIWRDNLPKYGRPIIIFLVAGLPYLGKLSLQIHTRINHIMKNKLPYCTIRFVFQTNGESSNQ